MILIDVDFGLVDNDEEVVKQVFLRQIPAVGEYVEVDDEDYEVTRVRHHSENDNGAFATLFVKE